MTDLSQSGGLASPEQMREPRETRGCDAFCFGRVPFDHSVRIH
jgi:hypothetical protein